MPLCAQAQPPPGYYDPAAGLYGQDLRAALYGIISPHTVIMYTNLWNVFEAVDAPWRGLGTIPGSGLRLREPWARHDAAAVLGVAADPTVADTPHGCRCGQVLTGRAEPEDCPHFGLRCTPEAPFGACMVAYEGTCHARFRAGARRRERRVG